MKTSVFITAVALSAVMTATSFAQEPPPGPPGPPGPMATPNAQMRQQFQAAHKQMEQIHAQERSQVLGALTPAHRQLLATVAGQLATSTTPDYRAAAQKLDAALSASEKQAIVSASQTARQQMRAQMESMRQRMSQMGGPPDTRGPMVMRSGTEQQGRTPSAGEILLRVAMSGGPEMHMEMRTGGSMHP